MSSPTEFELNPIRGLSAEVWKQLNKTPRPDGLTSSIASGSTPWNTPKHFPSKHVKQEGCETSGKYLRKWLKTWLMFYFGPKMTQKLGLWGQYTYFGAQNWPKNWTSEAHILHTSENTCNERVKQYWCETSENFLGKWPKTWILTYFGTHNGPKIGSLRHIFHTPLKVLAMSMWSNTDMKQVKTFWESD